jgi:hypothetical protein
MSAESAIDLFLQICAGLGYAHAEGVVHRDIKPSNIILAYTRPGSDERVPKIVDFGIAKLGYSDNTMTLTHTGDIIGTPLYMSPEQCMASSVDHRSDIYSAGCMLYECLAGSPPFSGASGLETMMQHSLTVAPTLKEGSLGMEFPEALERIVAKLLAKDPKDRYQSCQSLALDLMRFQSGESRPEQLAQSAEEIAGKQARKTRRQDYLVVLFLAALCVGIGYWAGNKWPWYEAPLSKAKFGIGRILGGDLPTTNVKVKEVPAPAPVVTTIEPVSPVANVSNQDTFFLATVRNHDTGRRDKLYKFPDRGAIGFFIIQDAKGRAYRVTAKGFVTVPADATVVFQSQKGVDDGNPVWRRFRTDDLDGVEHFGNDGSAIFDSDFGDFIGKMPSRLKSLFLISTTLSPQSFQNLGRLPKLRWLTVKKVILARADGGRNQSGDRIASGEDWAQLPILPKLSNLDMSSIQNPSAVLKKVAKGALTRLRLSEPTSALTKTDIEVIANLPNLNVLSLYRVKLDPDVRLFDQLSRAKKLETLSLIVSETVDWQGLAKLKHLRKLYIEEATAQVRGAIPHGCSIVVSPYGLPWENYLPVGPMEP